MAAFAEEGVRARRLVDIVTDGFDLGVRCADLVLVGFIAIPLDRLGATWSWQAGRIVEVWAAAC